MYAFVDASMSFHAFAVDRRCGVRLPATRGDMSMPSCQASISSCLATLIVGCVGNTDRTVPNLPEGSGQPSEKTRWRYHRAQRSAANQTPTGTKTMTAATLRIFKTEMDYRYPPNVLRNRRVP